MGLAPQLSKHSLKLPLAHTSIKCGRTYEHVYSTIKHTVKREGSLNYLGKELVSAVYSVELEEFTKVIGREN